MFKFSIVSSQTIKSKPINSSDFIFQVATTFSQSFSSFIHSISKINPAGNTINPSLKPFISILSEIFTNHKDLSLVGKLNLFFSKEFFSFFCFKISLKSIYQKNYC
ncbi:MAG: hypothetical protein LBC61_02250 [Candidatus Peribacteria bacterium]|nr:hypothetical protein [Candidatus Peribacteria bacterium]